MNTPFLHQIPLKPLAADEIARLLSECADTDLLHAVLHTLRDKHAEITEAGHEPPAMMQAGYVPASTAPSAAEYRAHHAGAALACKELFFELLNAGAKPEE